MAAASLSSFNDAIFSATKRIRHILKQSADINWVLNEIKKIMNLKTLKTSVKNTYRTIWMN